MPTKPASPAADAPANPAPTAGETPAAAPRGPTHTKAHEFLNSLTAAPPAMEVNPLLHAPGEDNPLLMNPGSENPLAAFGQSPDAPEEAEHEESAEEQPAAETVDDETTEEQEQRAEVQPNPEGRKRLNINRKNASGEFVYSPQTRAAMQLSEDEGIDYEEARERLFGAREQPTAKTQAEAALAPLDAIAPKTVAEIESEISTLRIKRQAAVKNFKETDAADLTDQIDTLIMERQDAKERESQSRQAQGQANLTREQQQTKSFATAYEWYPDAQLDGSKLNLALNAEITRLEKAGIAYNADPEWPEALAAKIATRMGIARKTAPVAAIPAKAPVPTVVPRKASPISPGGVAAPVVQKTAVDLITEQMADAKARKDEKTYAKLVSKWYAAQGQAA